MGCRTNCIKGEKTVQFRSQGGGEKAGRREKKTNGSHHKVVLRTEEEKKRKRLRITISWGEGREKDEGGGKRGTKCRPPF